MPVTLLASQQTKWKALLTSLLSFLWPFPKRSTRCCSLPPSVSSVPKTVSFYSSLRSQTQWRMHDSTIFNGLFCRTTRADKLASFLAYCPLIAIATVFAASQISIFYACKKRRKEKAKERELPRTALRDKTTGRSFFERHRWPIAPLYTPLYFPVSCRILARGAVALPWPPRPPPSSFLVSRHPPIALSISISNRGFCHGTKSPATSPESAIEREYHHEGLTMPPVPVARFPRWTPYVSKLIRKQLQQNRVSETRPTPSTSGLPPPTQREAKRRDATDLCTLHANRNTAKRIEITFRPFTIRDTKRKEKTERETGNEDGDRGTERTKERQRRYVCVRTGCHFILCHFNPIVNAIVPEWNYSPFRKTSQFMSFSVFESNSE